MIIKSLKTNMKPEARMQQSVPAYTKKEKNSCNKNTVLWKDRPTLLRTSAALFVFRQMCGHHYPVEVAAIWKKLCLFDDFLKVRWLCVILCRIKKIAHRYTVLFRNFFFGPQILILDIFIFFESASARSVSLKLRSLFMVALLWNGTKYCETMQSNRLLFGSEIFLN